MGRRSDHSRDELEALILDNAVALFAEAGLRAFSMRKLAKRIGYTVGSLYNLFNNQDELILAVNLRTAKAIHRQLSHALTVADESKARITELADAYLSWAKQEPMLWQLAFEHRLPQTVAVSETLLDEVNSTIRSIYQLVEAELAKAFPKLSQKEISLHSTSIWTFLQGSCQVAVSAKHHWLPDTQLEQIPEAFITTYWRGLS